MYASSADAQPAANDPLEESLPQGAIVRLGTMRFRAGSSWSGGRLTVSRDGKRLLSGGYGNVLVWNVATGQLLQRIPARPMGQDVEFSADGAQVIVNDHVPTGNTSTAC